MSENTKHKVFVSFHHANDQEYKDALVKFGTESGIFTDGSVNMGEIPDDWDAQKIREYIRDEHLKDTTVTILLVGTETKNRKHVDWELYSSMFNGKKNKKSGILVINLPSVNCSNHTLCSKEEKTAILPYVTKWISITEYSGYEERYPYMPARIIDNLLKSDVKISVVNWDDVYGHADKLRLLIEKAFESRISNDYDMSREMRMRNS